MDRKVRLVARMALSLGMLPGLVGLAGCSEEGSIPSSPEQAAKSRDERQKAREYGTAGEKGTTAKAPGR